MFLSETTCNSVKAAHPVTFAILLQKLKDFVIAVGQSRAKFIFINDVLCNQVNAVG
jgi:hypothetical protein